MIATAQMVTCRLAQPHEGHLVQQLVVQAHGPQWAWLDWSQVYPYWLIGCVHGEPRGTVMAAPGVPFGRIEMLSVDEQLPKREKAMLVKGLVNAALASVRAMGGQVALSMISETEVAWAQVLANRGWQVVDHGALVVKRVV